MKNFLKFNLFFCFLILSHATSFSQGTCGEIVPFASEPVVDGCCVTYEMDLSIGVNWILYPGNGVPQSESSTSFSNGGSNTVDYCYEPTNDPVYPNVSYYDANWNLICSSFYPVILDCGVTPEPTCGLAAEIVIDECTFYVSVYSSIYNTSINFYYNGYSAGSLYQSMDPNNSISHLSYPFFTSNGTYTYELNCINGNGDIVDTYIGSFTLDDCNGPVVPRDDSQENDNNSNVTVGNEISVNIFPNPASEKLTIDAPNQVIRQIQLFDINNRLIIDRKLNEEELYDLDLSHIQSSGIYYLHFTTDDNTYNEKIIIQK